MLDKFAILVADASRGIRIPQYLATVLNWDNAYNYDKKDFNAIKHGPDHPNYHESWIEILDSAVFEDSEKDDWILTVSENGDVFLVDACSAALVLDSAIKDRVEYEESHVDAGDNYAHMPAEGDTSEQIARLSNYVKNQYGVSLGDDDLDTLHDMCLDQFEMRSEYILAMPSEDYGFTLDSYLIGQVEVDLQEYSGHVAFAPALEYCYEYITEQGLGYVSSDRAWQAFISRDKMKEFLDTI